MQSRKQTIHCHLERKETRLPEKPRTAGQNSPRRAKGKEHVTDSRRLLPSLTSLLLPHNRGGKTVRYSGSTAVSRSTIRFSLKLFARAFPDSQLQYYLLAGVKSITSRVNRPSIKFKEAGVTTLLDCDLHRSSTQIFVVITFDLTQPPVDSASFFCRRLTEPCVLFMPLDLSFYTCSPSFLGLT